MDIKGIVRNVIPFSVKGKADSGVQARTKTDANNDREGNGQGAAGEEQKRRAFTPEEIQEIIQYLQELKGVKDNGLTVRLSAADGVNIIYVEDRSGKIVRRIPESDFGVLIASRKQNSQKKSGNLLNKAL